MGKNIIIWKGSEHDFAQPLWFKIQINSYFWDKKETKINK